MARFLQMKLQAMKKLNFLQWCWMGEAYLRLWPVQIRIRFSQPAWLIGKVLFTDGADASVSRQRSDALSPLVAPMCQQMHESVRLAARCHWSQPACLPRSIVLADMLIRRGLSASVTIGVHKPGGQQSALSSHAWVEVQGVTIAEPEAINQRFTQLNSRKS